MTVRRTFLAQLAVGAAGLLADSDELRATGASRPSGPWDTSWIDRVATAKFRVVFNASDISGGASLDYAATFLDHFHEVEGTTDAQTRPVIVARRLGVALGVNDAMWDRFSLGEDLKITDSRTQLPARRNVFWAAGNNANSDRPNIESLQRRGLIVLVCNVALGGMAYGLASQAKRDVEEVTAELRANLVPGAILVPSGIYALIRAQNTGCAYMPGT